MKHSHILLAVILSVLLGGCAEDMSHLLNESELPGKIILSGNIEQQYVSRADDYGFADGDVIGIYVVDYEGNRPGELAAKGNRADNVRHTFDVANRRWEPAYDIFWKDKHTAVDIYGYYPVAVPEDVDTYSFTIQTDQSVEASGNSMSAYEASDFLWGKVEAVEPTDRVISLPMAHKMANVRVTLEMGAGFSKAEWEGLKKQVLVTNTRQEAEINLATGSVSAVGKVSSHSVIPYCKGTEWRAIVVPQTMEAATQLFSISIDGTLYKYSKSESYRYLSGQMSNFSIRVDKKTVSGDYTLTLTGESITEWENDPVSHDALSREYTVVHSVAGGLEEAIRTSGNDISVLKNLKITGELNSYDFYYMRDNLPVLQSLNLKEVRIIGAGYEPHHIEVNCLDDQIPGSAFYDYYSGKGKESLTRVILPDRLRSIGARAFYKCHNLSGSLTIPEGVIDIEAGAFTDCTALTGTLTLPSSLKYIGNSFMSRNWECNETYDEASDYCHGVFAGCGFSGELRLPEGVELIRGFAFYNCRRLYGTLRLPGKLRHIGESAFQDCNALTGALEIPQGVEAIPDNAFSGCGFDGALLMHDGMMSIGENAFAGAKFKGELNLPESLVKINENVFNGCDFSGNLKLPPHLISIGRRAFANNARLSGTLTFPDGMNDIGVGAFANCSHIEGLVFPESIETIGYDGSEDGGAFKNCFSIGSIVCKSSVPPHIEPGVFDGVAKDNFVLEVPESSVMAYRTAVGWREFSRVAAHHELVCRPEMACALSTGHTQLLTIDSEGEWEAVSKPDWCSLSQTAGFNKTQVALTIHPSGSSVSREGEIVFRLKGKDYTHSCHVSQYGYDYGEDEYLMLQEATRGCNGGINVVILGDGYDAEEIASGMYLGDMKEAMEHLFSIEPYTSYKAYFNVCTAFALSTESGVGSLNTIRHNRFSTTFTGGTGLACEYDEIFQYVLNAPTVNKDNLNQTLIIVVPNTSDYGGVTRIWESGATVSICPKSADPYPYDFRGVVQHEAGGHGFGKLGDEAIYHNAFIDECTCKCCLHDEFRLAKKLGWYDNLELTGKQNKVGWSHLIFDSRYSQIVDVFEGGFMHSRGVYRSEQNSCMNNFIPYYSTISRESIVRRIKRYAGENFSFEEFAENDKVVLQSTRSSALAYPRNVKEGYPPVIIKGSPLRDM